jgi:hypothetical protein
LPSGDNFQCVGSRRVTKRVLDTPVIEIVAGVCDPGDEMPGPTEDEMPGLTEAGYNNKTPGYNVPPIFAFDLSRP